MKVGNYNSDVNEIKERRYQNAVRELDAKITELLEGDTVSPRVMARRMVRELNNAEISLAIDGTKDYAYAENRSNQSDASLLAVIQDLARFLPELYKHERSPKGKEPLESSALMQFVRVGAIPSTNARNFMPYTKNPLYWAKQLEGSLNETINALSANDIPTYTDKVKLSFLVALNNALHVKMYGEGVDKAEYNPYAEGAGRINDFVFELLKLCTPRDAMSRWTDYDGAYWDFYAWARGYIGYSKDEER
jgi:hypothetical protein